MSKKSINGHFPPDWGIDLVELRKYISDRLSGSQLSSDELEDSINELLQETVDRYMRYAKDPDANIRDPKLYILGIAKYACIEFLKQRKKKLMTEVPFPEAEEKEDSRPLESIPDERNQPESLLLQEEGRRHIFSLISQLRPRVQKVIRLTAEGVEPREIVRQTSLSPATVDKYLRDGRKELQQLITLGERSK